MERKGTVSLFRLIEFSTVLMFRARFSSLVEEQFAVIKRGRGRFCSGARAEFQIAEGDLDNILRLFCFGYV